MYFTLVYANGEQYSTRSYVDTETMIKTVERVNSLNPPNKIVKIINNDDQTSEGGVVWIA